MIYQTENQEIISINTEYQRLIEFINKLKRLKGYLLDNNIIKQSPNYTVLFNDKFSYSAYSKYEKIVLKDFVTEDELNFYNDLQLKYSYYTITLEDELVYVSSRECTKEYYMSYSKSDIAGFKYGNMYELKQKLKQVLKHKLENKIIRTI